MGIWKLTHPSESGESGLWMHLDVNLEIDEPNLIAGSRSWRDLHCHWLGQDFTGFCLLKKMEIRKISQVFPFLENLVIWTNRLDHPPGIKNMMIKSYTEDDDDCHYDDDCIVHGNIVAGCNYSQGGTMADILQKVQLPLVSDEGEFSSLPN